MATKLVREGLPRQARLRRRSEFLRVQEAGRRVQTPRFVVVVIGAPDGLQRVGVTVSSRVGGAVVRNRVKRIVREVFRRHKEAFPRQAWIVVIAKQAAARATYSEAAEDILGACRRLGPRRTGS